MYLVYIHFTHSVLLSTSYAYDGYGESGTTAQVHNVIVLHVRCAFNVYYYHLIHTLHTLTHTRIEKVIVFADIHIDRILQFMFSWPFRWCAIPCTYILFFLFARPVCIFNIRGFLFHFSSVFVPHMQNLLRELLRRTLLAIQFHSLYAYYVPDIIYK